MAGLLFFLAEEEEEDSLYDSITSIRHCMFSDPTFSHHRLAAVGSGRRSGRGLHFFFYCRNDGAVGSELLDDVLLLRTRSASLLHQIDTEQNNNYTTAPEISRLTGLLLTHH